MEQKENEQLNIQVKNQVIQETSLVKVEYNISFIFQTICTCFGTSLFIQLINVIPSIYNLANTLTAIIASLLIVFSLVLIVMKKEPTIKTYLLILSFLLGLVIGV